MSAQAQTPRSQLQPFGVLDETRGGVRQLLQVDTDGGVLTDEGKTLGGWGFWLAPARHRGSRGLSRRAFGFVQIEQVCPL